MDKLRVWSETYEHAEFGEIEVTWLVDAVGRRTTLIAMQPDLWVPADEVADCLRWARDLQCSDIDECDDAKTRSALVI